MFERRLLKNISFRHYNLIFSLPHTCLF
jgi:hypothetical protein